ncbi:sll1863 family stress response protein [Methylomonas sp. MgM2]
MTNRDQYVAKMKAKLDEWNADIDRLEAKTKNTAADARIGLQKEIQAIKAQRGELVSKLEEVENASEEAWEDIKTGAESAWRSFSNAVKSAADRF